MIDLDKLFSVSKSASNKATAISMVGKDFGIQGDIALTRVDSIPSEAVCANTDEGRYILAHSETGHHHAVLENEGVLYKTEDPMVAYLVVDNVANLKHYKPGVDAHRTVAFDKGVYRINRQREYTPEGLRAVAD
jgi:hypothetical protein